MIVTAVLVKGFDSAKQRLAAVLDPARRRALAERGAELAVAAAAAAGPVLVVAGTEEAAAWARAQGAEVVLEKRPDGQNGAALEAIDWARERGADGLLLLSSDLPLVTAEAVAAMLAEARAMGTPAVVAAPAIGRGGTNALFLAPPGVIPLHFGNDSLRKFEAEARRRRIPFALHESDELALDLDEPDDLARLPRPPVASRG
jgi:2-phospho-L-lactate guanylyltransferase